MSETGVAPSTANLDVGRGAGPSCRLAGELGASVTGPDAAAELVANALKRVPEGDLRVGEMRTARPFPTGRRSGRCRG
jgi:2-polyprenyl-3-methyl-5-hydroxy-6-metoxy-1,4-benzoquinol methylase